MGRWIDTIRLFAVRNGAAALVNSVYTMLKYLIIPGGSCFAVQ